MLEPKFFTFSRPGDVRLEHGMSKFDSDPPSFNRTLFLAQNSRNISKSNRISPGKAIGDKALNLTYLDSRMTKMF